MTVESHRQMALGIYKWMSHHHMPLNKTFFVFGNLYPDVCFSFISRPHIYSKTIFSTKNLLMKLYLGRKNPRSACFSFYLGIATHYICDYFCYPHTSAFWGDSHEHTEYEKNQRFHADEILLDCNPERVMINFFELLTVLDYRILNHEQTLFCDLRFSRDDIPQALEMASWISSVLYMTARKRTVNYLVDHRTPDWWNSGRYLD